MPIQRAVKNYHKTRRRVRRRVKLAIVPFEANQYRPRAVGRYGIVVIVLLILCLQGVYNGITEGNVLGVETQITANGLLSATNNERVSHGEVPLKINAELNKAAEMKVKNMFAEQYWAHNAPDGTTPWHWFSEAGYDYDNAGENLAKNFSSDSGTVDAWMASSTHRANILNNKYQDVGFAYMESTLDGKPTTIIVALYGSPELTAVQGAKDSANYLASNMHQQMSIMTRFGLGIQSMTPVAVASIIVLLVGACLALAAQAYRSKLPRKLRYSWYRHHGIYKAIGFTSLAIILVFAYGSTGQI